MPLSAQVDSLHLRQEIQKIIHWEAQHDYEKTPGFIVAAVMPDTQFYFSFGVSSRADSSLITPETFFELGAFSQIFTALLAVQLADRGHWALTDTLGGLLPASASPAPPLGSLTLGNLLRHEAGFERIPYGIGQEADTSRALYSSFNRRDLLDYLSTADLNPGKGGYRYSHIDYALSQYLLEQQTGVAYAALLDTFLLQPFGWKQTGVVNEYSAGQLSSGYSLGGQDVSPPSSYGAFTGSLGLYSTASDLVALIRFFQAEGQDWKHRTYRESIPTGIRKNTRAGYGWHIIQPRRKKEVIVHTGASQGHRVYLAMVPATQTGVVVLSNSPHGLSGIGYLVLRMLNRNWRK